MSFVNEQPPKKVFNAYPLSQFANLMGVLVRLLFVFVYGFRFLNAHQMFVYFVYENWLNSWLLIWEFAL